MTTRTSHKVGASKINTATAGTPAPALGVPVPGPTDIVTASGTAAAHGGPPSAQELAAALKVCSRALAPILAALMPSLETIANGQRNHHSKVTPTQASVVPMVSELLRLHPDLSSDVTADDLDADMANVAMLRALVTTFARTSLPVDDTRRLVLESVWHKTDVVYAVARTRAKRDPEMALAVAPIRDALARGAASEKAAHVALTQQHKAAAATARATRATQKAAVATTRAANTHPKQPRNSRGTSPVPLANPQGPAASADVAPQGPAPGR